MPVFIPLLVIVAIAVVAVLIFGFSSSMIGYGLLKTTAKFGSSTLAPTSTQKPSSSGWTFQYSPNMPQQMWDNGDGTYYFDFPSKDGCHYVVKTPTGLSQGKTVTMVFNLTGTGTLKCSDTTDPGNPHVRLYIQRKGDTMSGTGQYQQYRYWSVPYADMTPGDHTLTAPITPDKWSDVFGDSGALHSAEFQACLANAGSIGFTFGGSFAGHGLYAINGSMRFMLKSFTIS